MRLPNIISFEENEYRLALKTSSFDDFPRFLVGFRCRRDFRSV